MKKKYVRKSIVLLVVFLPAVLLFLSWQGQTRASEGQIYYVSQVGSDTGQGTKSDPFLTIQKGISKLNPGDTLNIMEGTYEEKLEIASQGTAKKPITIRGTESGKTIISGNKKSGTLMSLLSAKNVTVKNICFQDLYGNDSCGIYVSQGARQIKLENNQFHRIRASLPIEEDNCANAILVMGDDAKKTVYGVTIRDNCVEDCSTGWAEAISVTGNVSHVKIVNNTLENTGNIGIDISGNYGYCKDKALDFPRQCTITGNTVTGCHSDYATAYGIYVDGGQHISIRSNVVTGCDGGIELGAENAARLSYATGSILVEKNKIKNNRENGITIGGYEKNLGWVTDVKILNNKCINNGIDNAILTLAKCRNVDIGENELRNDSGEAYIIYNDFPSQYTRNISFYKNKYGNGMDQKNTSFMYHRVEFHDFALWVENRQDKTSVYIEP